MPLELFHYTSFSAFCSIIANRKLRFTNISFLNDSMEYKFGLGLFKQEIIDYETRNNIRNRFNLNLLDEFTFLSAVYTVSFCENVDDLNLWRGYCPKEGGIAIGFDKDQLFNSNKVILNKCIYTNPYKGIIVDSNYSRIKQKFSNIESLHKDHEHIKFTYDLAHLKSESFIAENEWRGVTMAKDQHIEYHVKNSIIVPYCDISFNKASIKRILIGPTRYQDKIEEGIGIMVKKHGINCEIVKSTVPFVQY